MMPVTIHETRPDGNTSKIAQTNDWNKAAQIAEGLYEQGGDRGFTYAITNGEQTRHWPEEDE